MRSSQSRELLVDDPLDEGLRLGVAELGLRLALELRLAELDRDDRGQALADVVAGEVVVLLLEQPLVARVPLTSVVSAARKPSSWVPPSWVLIVFAKVWTPSEYAVVHCIATSSDELALGVLGLEVDDLGVHRLGLLASC